MATGCPHLGEDHRPVAEEKAMTADAINSRTPVGPGAGRVADTSAPAARHPQASSRDPVSAKGDRIEVSEAARALQDQITRDTPPASELPAARLGELLRRLNSGFYDKPQVVDTVVSRLARDL